jgi:sec-independent protein translocase protein TatC
MLHRYYLEIKNRILLLLVAWVAIILVSYVFKEVLLSIVTTDYVRFTTETPYFIFTDVVEVFSVYMLLVFFVGNQVLVLYVFYHLLVFTRPGLTKTEYSFFLFLYRIGGFLLFLAVIVFNKLLFPFSWNFFLSFKNFGMLKSLTLHFEAKLLEYLVFYTAFYYACVLYFQFFLLPILLFKYLGNELGVYHYFRKFLYYACVVFSTTVTPPDVLSQVVLSFILIISCEILVFCSTFKNVLDKSSSLVTS